MKIVSLLPSATEIVCALGLHDQLVAVTHECDYPSAAVAKPVITSSVLHQQHRSSGDIHRGISGLVHEGKSIYHLDESLLAELQPDLILTQELCDVCAVSYSLVVEAARVLSGETEIISLEPTCLKDIFSNIALVADRTGQGEAGPGSFSQALMPALKRSERKPSTSEITPVFIAWNGSILPFAAGIWVPEMVEIAGGREIFDHAGQVSEQVEWQSVVSAAPEVLILMPCGFCVQQALAELGRLQNLPGWWDLPAVRSGQVFAVNGSAYFNRPGPRVVRGVEVLEQIIQPAIFAFTLSEDACRRVY
jgi:iron complex transport system substrate-binding protein